MKKKITAASLLLVYALVLVIYNVVFFMLPIEKNMAGFVAYGFAILAILISGVVSYLSLGTGETIISKMYGAPVIKVGVVYALVQVALSVLVLLISTFLSIPLWVILMVSIILLCVTGIGLIATYGAKTIIEEQEKQIVSSTQKMREFRLDVDYLVDVCQNPEVKKEMEELAEKFRYSDPVSSDALVEIEARLKAEVEVLGTMINEEPTKVIERIRRIDVILADRNRKCMAYKR